MVIYLTRESPAPITALLCKRSFAIFAQKAPLLQPDKNLSHSDPRAPPECCSFVCAEHHHPAPFRRCRLGVPGGGERRDAKNIDRPTDLKLPLLLAPSFHFVVRALSAQQELLIKRRSVCSSHRQMRNKEGLLTLAPFAFSHQGCISCWTHQMGNW